MTKLLVPVLLLASLLHFGNCMIPVSECKCWVRDHQRVSCTNDAFISRGQCQALGCCYFDEGKINTPICYKKADACPPPVCLIEPQSRIKCLSRDSPSASLCKLENCCYEPSQEPNCYKSSDGSRVRQKLLRPIQRSMMNLDVNVPHGPNGIYSFGEMQISIQCGPSVQPCNGNSPTPMSCLRKKCCWQPSSFPGQNKCFESIKRVLNYKETGEWKNWQNWGNCLGHIPCTTGTRFRYRVCSGGVPGKGKCTGESKQEELCVASCGSSVIPSEWGVWSSYGSCVSAEPLCLSGIRTRTRQCSNNGLVVSSTLCTGGIAVATESSPCNTNLCSKFDAWVNGSCSLTCGTGTLTSTRTCVTGTAAASCTSKTASCSQTTCPVYEWDQWTSWSSCSDTCTESPQTRTRVCKDKISGTPATTAKCAGSLTPTQTETQNCNAGSCTAYSAWALSACSVTCAAGTQSEKRTCTASGTIPAGCDTQNSKACDLGVCPTTDKDLDIVVLVDGSSMTDSCLLKEITLGWRAPFTSASGLLTRTNFPYYFKQLDIVNGLLSDWKTVALDKTRLALHDNSGACTYVSNSDTTSFFQLNYLNEAITKAKVDTMSMACGLNNVPYSLNCIHVGHFIATNGDRPTSKNVLIIFLGDYRTLPSGTSFLNVIGIVRKQYTKYDLIAVISTLDHTTLTTTVAETQEKFCNSYGCMRKNPNGCVRYIGHLGEPYTTIVPRFRTMVNANL